MREGERGEEGEKEAKNNKKRMSRDYTFGERVL